ncbi:MAG TPA: glycosyltransferase [Pseudonocardiaceae bacterium]|nr:glycosyltransferase [Pseudonocardiaceae bacterium]
MKRVLCCHPSAERYGADRIFAESVRAFAEAGWQVTATLPNDGDLVPVLREAGADVVFCPTPVLRKAALRPAGLLALLAETARAIAPMTRLLRRVRPDLVYVNTVTVPAWLALAKLLGKRVVAHVHEAEDAVPAPIRTALALPLLAAGTVLVNSEATAATVTRGVPALRRRIRLLYNGVEGPAESTTPRAEPRDPARIVLVGRLSPRKGTDVAIEAIGRLSQKRAVILDVYGSVFTGYEWFETQLRQRIADLELADSVRLHGFHADVWPAYADADIALVPSRVEPFGNTAVEAQLAGIPVIVTDAQGLPETVAGGRFGAIVPADDPGALADAINALLDDWPATRATAIDANANARTAFAPATYRARLLELLG